MEYRAPPPSKEDQQEEDVLPVIPLLRKGLSSILFHLIPGLIVYKAGGMVLRCIPIIWSISSSNIFISDI